MKRTPLYEIHKKRGAKLVEFGGWEMPLFYTGVVAEHRAVREHAGLFDICHMGRLGVTGPDAKTFLQWVTVNNVAGLNPGNAQYSLVCNPRGGVKDDIFIYQKGMSDYFICVNASNREKIYQWFLNQKSKWKVDVRDVSEETAMLALQGPLAPDILKKILGGKYRNLKHAEFDEMDIASVPVMIARTGYTGERGFEFYFPARFVVKLWNLFLENGKEKNLVPVGLGARDTLRLEMGYALYGHELDESISPLEADLGRFVSFDKGDFIGREVLWTQAEKGVSRIVVGFELISKNVPRQHCKVFHDGIEIGEVTSGNLTPSVQKGIGMALIQADYNKPGDTILIGIRDKKVPAVITGKCFYKKLK